MATLRYTVTRGEAKGEVLHPHRYNDGRYVASMTRFKKDYVRVSTIEELIAYIGKGFSIRMSNQFGHHAPSLIAPASIEILDTEDKGRQLYQSQSRSHSRMHRISEKAFVSR